MKIITILILLFPIISLAQFSQKDSLERKKESGLLVYEFTKISTAFYNCELFYQSINGKGKDVAVEHKYGVAIYNKEEVQEWIAAIESILAVKTGKIDNGKRQAIYYHSDGQSAIFIGLIPGWIGGSSLGTLVRFKNSPSIVTSIDAAEGLLKGFKKAHDGMR